MKKFLRILAYLLVSVLATLLLVAAVTQTQFFRDRLRSVASAQLDSVLIADVRIGPITGNLISGFSIDSVAFIVDDHPLIAVDRVDIRYDLFQIPGRRITVSSLTLVRPRVHLLRGTDSVWNIKRFIRPTPPDKEPSGPFTWPVQIERCEIQDGLLVVADSLVMHEIPAREILSAHRHVFDVRNINLLFSARISPEEKELRIDRLSAVADSQQIVLNTLSGTFTVTPTGARVKDLSIATSRSVLRLNASLQKFNLLGGIELRQLEHCPATVDLQGSPIDLRELQQLVPGTEFLNGEATIELSASGEFGKLGIHQLDLGVGQSRLRWHGTIANLHRPSDLTLAVKLQESTINPGDVVHLMPPFHLPDYSHLGPVQLALDFDGKPVDFRTKLALRTSAGNASADVALKIGGPQTLRYAVTAHGENLNPGRILNQPQLNGDVTGTVDIAGEGTSLATLASTCDIAIDKSEFRGVPLTATHLHLDARQRSVVASLAVHLGEMTSQLQATYDRRNATAPRLSVEGSVDALNLATLLHDHEYDSDLTLRLHADAYGSSLATLGGEALLDFSSSRYREYQLTSGDIHLMLDQRFPGAKHLRVASEIADMTVDGEFDLQLLPDIVRYQVENMRIAIGERLRSIDTSFVPDVDLPAYHTLEKSLSMRKDSVRATYHLQIKNLEPISVVAGERKFQGVGSLDGFLTGTADNMAAGGSLDSKYFYYGNVQKGVLLKGAQVNFDLSRLTTQPLRTGRMILAVSADEMHVGHSTFDSLLAHVLYDQEHATFAVRTHNASATHLAVAGNATVNDSGFIATIDSLHVGYGDYIWTADRGTHIDVAAAEGSVRDLVMRHDSAAVIVNAHLGKEERISGTVRARNLNLGDLREVMRTSDSDENNDFLEGLADVDLAVSGTLGAPVMNGQLHMQDISFQDVPFGKIAADLAYADTSLRITLAGGDYDGPDSLAPLHVLGTFPLALSFGAVDTLLPEKPMDLSIISTGTQMNILDPLLKPFKELTGIMRCRVAVRGTPRHPEYGGDMTFDNCEFLFVPNNIRYTLNASFTPSGERIKVNDATVRNLEADKTVGRIGEVHLSGDFAFSDFRPSDFNLQATGQLLVIKETSHLSALSLSGRLFLEIGQGGLRYTGNIEESLLKGAVVLRNSSLVFPPTQTSVQEEARSIIPVFLVDDTTKTEHHEGDEAIASFFSTGSDSTMQSAEGDSGSTPSFLDGVRYDLNIETAGGNNQIRMVFNAMTSEELVAYIDGKFDVLGDGRKWFGDLTVSNAYYSFFKRFNAEGTLRYRGEILNPELDIVAKYQGQRQSPDTASTGVTETIVVTATISGTRMAPTMVMSMTINSQDYYLYTGPTSKDVQGDAIAFIVTGNFPLTQAQRTDAGNDIRAALGGSLVTGATSILTNRLSDLLREGAGIPMKVDLVYDGKSSLRESADLSVSGVLGGGSYRYGGKILDNPFSNANVSLQYSLGQVFGNPSLRNLMFELERKVEVNPLSLTGELKSTSSARIFYRLSF